MTEIKGFIIRWDALIAFSSNVLGIVVLHLNLLHIGEVWDDRLILVGLVVMGLNKAVVSRKVERAGAEAPALEPTPLPVQAEP